MNTLREMDEVRASFEQLAVRGAVGVSWDEATATLALRGGSSYDTALIKLTANLDSNLLLLNRHVSLESFTVDAVVAQEEEEEDGGGGGGGVLSFIQERLVGSKSKNNTKFSSRAEEALMEAWEACKAQGYHGMHVLAKVTPDFMPQNSRLRYTPGQYAEALLNGFRSYYMFQRHHTLFQAEGVGQWGAGGGGCVEPVTVCYLVMAWRMTYPLTGRLTNRTTSIVNFTNTVASVNPAAATTAAATTATTTKRQGRKRAVATQNTNERPLTPPRKRARGRGRLPTPPPPQPVTTTDEEEEEEEEEEVTVNIGQQRDKIPDVWYSPDIDMSRRQQHPSPQRPAIQKPSSPRPANRTSSPQRPAIQKPLPQTPTNQKPSSQRPVNQSPRPQRVEEEEDDLGDLTFGFERSTPRGRGRSTTASTTSRKSVLLPQWSEDEKEELMHFFDTLNPSQTEQTCVALTCKFATMRFGQDLPSKQLYQLMQRKGRTIHPPLHTYTLPGGAAGVSAAAADLFRSLNPEVSESKRIAFTCRFMQTQYGAKINSKELYAILSGGKKKGGRAARV